MLTVTADAEGDALETEVDDEIRAFDEWFQRRVGNEALVYSEKAILKTFLWYKLRVSATEG